MIDQPRLAGRQLVALFIHDLHAHQRRPLADAARLRQPFLGADVEPRAAFAARIIFEQDRPQPFDHRALDLGRAGGRAMHDKLQTGEVEPLLHLLRRRQHALHHDRHEMGVRHAAALDGAEHLLGVPALAHEGDRHARGLRDRDVEGERRGVIARPGAHLDVRRRIIGRVRALELRRRGDAMRPMHALGPPRRAGGVEHLAAHLRIVQIGAVDAVERAVVVVEPVRLAADGKLQRDAGRLVHRLADRVEPRLRDQRLGLAVVQDIGDLVGLQVPVDRRHAQAAAPRRVQRLHELRPVGAEQRHAIAGLQSLLAQHARQPVRIRVDLGIAVLAEAVPDRRRVRLRLRPEGAHHAGAGIAQQPFEERRIVRVHGASRRAARTGGVRANVAGRNAIQARRPRPPVPPRAQIVASGGYSSGCGAKEAPLTNAG